MRGKRCSDDLFRVVCKKFDRSGKAAEVAEDLGMHVTTVSRLLKRRIGTSFQQRKVALGRPPLPLPRSFLQFIKRHRFQTWTRIAHDLRMSAKRVRRACRRLGYRSRVAVVDKLSNPQKRARVQWVKTHRQTDFRTWIFSDEAFFELADCAAPRRARVIRSAGEKYSSACVLLDAPKDRHGVMVWGCITSNGLSAFTMLGGTITGTVYTAVLEQHLLGLLDELPLAQRDAWTFQQDNAPLPLAWKPKRFFFSLPACIRPTGLRTVLT